MINFNYDIDNYILNNLELIKILKSLHCYTSGYTIYDYNNVDFLKSQIDTILKNDCVYYSCVDIIKRGYSILNSYNQKNCRLRRKIFSMIEFCKTYNFDLVFLTLTFNDNLLYNFTYNERKDTVKYYLSVNSIFSIANVDFGKTNEREHYHCLCVIPKNSKPFSSETWGSIVNVEYVHFNNTSKNKLSKYIAKLSKHAIKKTTKNERIIYINFRKYKKILDNIGDKTYENLY